MSWDCTCAVEWVKNSALSPVVYGDIALSTKINTQMKCFLWQKIVIKVYMILTMGKLVYIYIYCNQYTHHQVHIY